MAKQPMTAINAANMQLIRTAVNNALKQVAEDFGLESLHLGNIRMGTGHFIGSLEGRLKAENSPALQAEQKTHSGYMGYDRNIVGETFTSNGKKFIVKSLEINRPKYPIVADCLTDGKTYKFGAKHKLQFENKEIGWNVTQNMFAAH